RVWRPLLPEHRDDLLAVVGRSGLTPVTDASNDDLSLKRNSVRHRALPVLREIEPSVDDRLGALARIAVDEDALLAEEADRAFEGARLGCGGLSIEALNRLHIAIARRVIRTWLARDLDVVPTFDRVEALLDLARSGSQQAKVDVGEGFLAGYFGDAIRCGSLSDLRHRAWLDARLLLPLAGTPDRLQVGDDTITVDGASYEGSVTASRFLDTTGSLSVVRVRSGDAHADDPKRWNDWFRQRRVSPWIRDLVQGVAVDGVMWWIPRLGDYDDAGGDRQVCVVWSDQERG
ncbi:MAG: TilS substrate-binding domain-containing protein, partial [Thermomicrobiales bacterium]|nr:TilS substrate-binding domain-containing protein [Thermomicrobiales bacterium]